MVKKKKKGTESEPAIATERKWRIQSHLPRGPTGEGQGVPGPHQPTGEGKGKGEEGGEGRSRAPARPKKKKRKRPVPPGKPSFQKEKNKGGEYNSGSTGQKDALPPERKKGKREGKTFGIKREKEGSTQTITFPSAGVKDKKVDTGYQSALGALAFSYYREKR